MVLTPELRDHMARSLFALSGHRFPINDANHARMALSGATRSLNAGNISPAQAAAVRAKAHAFLRGMGGPG